MGKINMTRVILGGLLAGLIMNIGEAVLNMAILGDDWQTAMQALGLSQMNFASFGWYILMTFALGITMIWLYAVMRPKFGPGPKTAIITGLTIWFLMWVLSFGTTAVQGMFPAKIVLTTIIWGFFEVPIGALVGAWLYKEEETAGKA
ncbi:MAG: hypothetical protein HUU32_17360 [Calditrichaceae bacterium]|nr:hypothetical protein [Calditrichia bacterium]NUQ43160.1 hypothetical protein [Calditrichaceae bacterium]